MVLSEAEKRGKNVKKSDNDPVRPWEHIWLLILRIANVLRKNITDYTRQYCTGFKIELTVIKNKIKVSLWFISNYRCTRYIRKTSFYGFKSCIFVKKKTRARSDQIREKNLFLNIISRTNLSWSL